MRQRLGNGAFVAVVVIIVIAIALLLTWVSASFWPGAEPVPPSGTPGAPGG